MKQVINRQEEKCSKKNKDIWNRLITFKFGTLTKCNIHNNSEQQFFILSLGFNFFLPCSKNDKENIFLSFESVYKQSNKLKPR